MNDENPAQIAAEQAVLGAAMLGKNGQAGVMALNPEDFTLLPHQAICIAEQSIIRRGDDPDVLIVSDHLNAQSAPPMPGRAGTFLYLSDLTGSVSAPSSSMYYAGMVRDAVRVRRANDLAETLSAAMSRPDASSNLDQLMRRHSEALADIPPTLDNQHEAPLPTIADLFEKTFTKRWVVPGLIARRERIILTAAEGLAKSTLCSQFAIALAAGIHPLSAMPLDSPKRVLLIDAENDEEQSFDRYKWIGERINALGGTPGWAKMIQYQIRPEGFDIVGRDRTWFVNTVAKASPDLVIIGPAYKAMGAAKTNDDAAILAFFNVLDEVRVKYDCALMIEAHSGHAKDDDGQRSTRPFGSSVWQRWSEVGFGLRRNKELDAGQDPADVLDIVHWRGKRQQRSWPDLLQRGREGQMPWGPGRPDYWNIAAGKAS